jgi:predicted Zn-dependent protease
MFGRKGTVVQSQKSHANHGFDNHSLKFEWSTDDPAALREFKRGLQLFSDRSFNCALARFRKAQELEPGNPYYVSYVGLALAYAENKWADAEQLCENALRMKRNQAQLYLNLAEVLLRAGKKADAVDTLENGTVYASRDARIQRMLQFIGIRRPAVLPFLHRTHPLNRALGRFRHRLFHILPRR